MNGPLLSRERIAVAMIVLLLTLVAVFATTRLGGDGGADEPPPAAASHGADPPGDALLPVSDEEFAQAVDAAVEHGRALGTFDPAAEKADYFDRLRSGADTGYAEALAADGSAASAAHNRLTDWDRPTSGAARPRVAPLVSADAITVELAVSADPAATGSGAGGDPLELGAYQVSLRRDGGSWLVMGVTGTDDIDAMRGEGLI